MQSAKEKVSNMASAAKEKIQIAKAKVEEKVFIHLLSSLFVCSFSF